MRAGDRKMCIALVIGALSFPATIALSASDYGAGPKKNAPAKVEVVPGSRLKQITLTEKGAKRIDVQLGEIAVEESRQYVPYSAVVWDPDGSAWVYVNVKPLTYLRHAIALDTIAGSKAYLKDGPKPGTKVVITGVAELYGAEKGLH